jgi:hypothetical protein
VVRKEAVRLPPKNAFDDGAQVTMYQVAGQRRLYTLRSTGPALYTGKPLVAELGDLVLVCPMSIESHGSGSPYPPPFRDSLVSQGFAARLKAPPLIVKKVRWNPIHIVGEARMRTAIQQVQWRYPEDGYFLYHMRVEQDLGEGRYQIAADRQSFLVEAPATLKNRQLLSPGQYVWAILSHPRFDRSLKKLVLAVEDLEPQYFFSPDWP